MLATLQGHQPSKSSALPSNVQSWRAAAGQPASPPPHQIPSTGLAPSALGQGLAENRLREAGLSRSAATTLPITGQHELAQREPLTPGKGNGLGPAGGGQVWRPQGFPSMVTQYAQGQAITHHFCKRTGRDQSLPFVLSRKEAGPEHWRPCQERGWAGREGSCPSLWPEQGLEWSLLHLLPVPFGLRISLSPSLRPGASYSGFLMGSFL